MVASAACVSSGERLRIGQAPTPGLAETKLASPFLAVSRSVTGIDFTRRPLSAMTSQGSASGRFTRAIQQRNLFMAEAALREMGNPSLIWALDYVILLAELQPAKAKTAALRWHGRLELEAPTLTTAVSR